jgi:hypothetical protein
MLPAGFGSRVIARANEPVPGTAYPWHILPDGQATYALDDGGWILVSNSESLSATGAGSSAIRFRPDGSIASAYRILAGTEANCAGGPTPWGTWLSCEEHDGGQVWECDPLGLSPAVVRPALGIFTHEAVCVDSVGKRLYMTEDEDDGGFYRFTPSSYPGLTSGLLEVAVVAADGSVAWATVPDPSRITAETRKQVPAMTTFRGGEGIWFDSGFVYFTTKGDKRVWAYDTRSSQLDIVYDDDLAPNTPLRAVDNVTVSPFGDLYVCEDGDDMDICLITPDRVVARFLKLTGEAHDGSEMAGVIFDPSGTRMYFSSQRGFQLGLVYEVSGPFRMPSEPRPAAVPPPPPLPGGEAAPGSGETGATTTSADAPGLLLRAGRRIAASLLRRRGLKVRLLIDRPGTVTLAMRTSDLESEPGERGSTDRPKLVTLAKARRTFARRGRYVVRLRLSRRAHTRLRRSRRRSLGATVTAQAVDLDGDLSVATRRIEIALRARRR